jgi:hypothetical protein
MNEIVIKTRIDSDFIKSFILLSGGDKEMVNIIDSFNGEMEIDIDELGNKIKGIMGLKVALSAIVIYKLAEKKEAKENETKI